ncbi:MAG: DUF1905 domain-containing protein [Ardenticatenia bacterium]|nr:DUF1905 domain-containing protein [Ardenticatenia bacterium]
MVFEFEAAAISWRGPAPFVFVPVPPEISDEIKSVSKAITYGWGVIPATVRIGGTTFSTSLFPRQGIYLVPVKVLVQKAEQVDIGDLVRVRLEIDLRG